MDVLTKSGIEYTFVAEKLFGETSSGCDFADLAQRTVGMSPGTDSRRVQGSFERPDGFGPDRVLRGRLCR